MASVAVLPLVAFGGWIVRRNSAAAASAAAAATKNKSDNKPPSAKEVNSSTNTSGNDHTTATVGDGSPERRKADTCDPEKKDNGTTSEIKDDFVIVKYAESAHIRQGARASAGPGEKPAEDVIAPTQTNKRHPSGDECVGPRANIVPSRARRSSIGGALENGSGEQQCRTATSPSAAGDEARATDKTEKEGALEAIVNCLLQVERKVGAFS